MDRRPAAPEHGSAALAVGPFGPWVAPSAAELDGLPESELGLGYGPDGPDGDELRPPETGTALDEFLPIYWYMARATKLHPAQSPDQVDALDIAVLAMLLGVQPETPEDDLFGPLSGDFEADSARLIARRLAAAAAERPGAASSA
jgi:hypothetical protein